jgi:CheY-like chemotaxis protein
MLTHCAREPEDTGSPARISSQPTKSSEETSSVASTLLAVDDSVTMRKVLEITFASPDFRVVTANSPDAALQKLKADKPDLVIADGTLEPKNGYDLCKEIKRLSPGTPVLYLSSKQNPFDAGKGAGAQVDDHMDKPFDTQQMIDKVKRLLSGQPAAAAAAPKPAAGSAQTTPSMAAPTATTAQSAPIKAAANPLPPAATGASTPLQRAKTLIYNPPAAVGAPAAPAPAPAPTPARTAPAAIAPTPVAGVPVQPRVAAPAPSVLDEPTTKTTSAPAGREPAATRDAAPAPALASAAAHVNGQMAGKLEQLGLTPAQAEAVLALSREVVERVVWEVVPVLAETIIKEELARLTK